jgi:hypothetical protein
LRNAKRSRAARQYFQQADLATLGEIKRASTMLSERCDRQKDSGGCATVSQLCDLVHQNQFGLISAFVAPMPP